MSLWGPGTGRPGPRGLRIGSPSGLLCSLLLQPPRLPDQVRLLQRRHQPHRRDQQDRPESLRPALQGALPAARPAEVRGARAPSAASRSSRAPDGNRPALQGHLGPRCFLSLLPSSPALARSGRPSPAVTGWKAVFHGVCVSCRSILEAPATAELEPLADGQVSQTDEVRGGGFGTFPHLPPPGFLHGLLSAPRNWVPSRVPGLGAQGSAPAHCWPSMFHSGLSRLQPGGGRDMGGG